MVSIIINGNYFSEVQGSSTVTFTTVQATVTSWSNTAIQVIVPATISGPVVVTVEGRSSNSVDFTIVRPSITSISPGHTLVSESVTISGNHFKDTQGTSTVTFNGVSAGTAVSCRRQKSW